MPPSSLSLLALAPSIPGLPGGGPSMGSMLAGLGAVPVAAAIYFFLVWGKRGAGECEWKDDDQIGFKVIVGVLILVGTALFASGLKELLHLLLTFKEFVARIKGLLPDLLVGAAVLGGAIMFVVPKTNHEQHPKALRMVAGAIALVGAVATVLGLDDLLKTVFVWPSWHAVAGSLTALLTAAIVLGGSGYFFAKMIGVEVPDIPMPAEAQQLQQQVQQAYQGQQQQAQAQQQQQYQQPPQQQQQQQQYQQPPQQQQYQQPQQGGGGYPPPPGGGGYPPPPGGGGYNR